MVDHYEEIRKSGGDFAKYVIEHPDTFDTVMPTYTEGSIDMGVFDHLPAMVINASLDDNRFRPYVASMIARKVDLSSDCMIEVMRSCIFMDKGNLLAALLRNGASTQCDGHSCRDNVIRHPYSEYEDYHGREGPLDVCKLSMTSQVCLTSLCKSGYLWEQVCARAKKGRTTHWYRRKTWKSAHVNTTELEYLDWLHAAFTWRENSQMSKEDMYGILKATRTIIVKIPLIQDLANIVSEYSDLLTFEDSWVGST